MRHFSRVVRFILWIFTHTIYRIRVIAPGHVPVRGPALLVCNHISHVDTPILGAAVRRYTRFLVHRPYFEMPVLGWLLRLMEAIPAAAGTPGQTRQAIDQARDALAAGDVVCLFAEGGISRTGNLLPFTRSLEQIVEGLDVPVVPVFLDRLWGSVFSFKGGRFFWKVPERIPYPVTVAFGPPLESRGLTASAARQAMLELGAVAMRERFSRDDRLHTRFLRSAKRHWRALSVADSTGRTLTFGRALTAVLLLSRRLRSRCAGQQMVGVMMPASVGAALANAAITMAGKVAVNLNFTAGREAMASMVEQCGIQTVVTSRMFLVKAKLDAPSGALYLEDLMKGITAAEKIRTALTARLLPARALEGIYAPEPTASDDLATVIFSSGSTGVPKGIMLSHRNVLSVIEGMAQMFWVTPKDRMMGVLPFFHSFGFTGGLWFPLACGFGAVYHTSPMDAGVVGELVQKFGATLLISTPTFCASYARKCTREEFQTLRVVAVGAEKLREPVARAFRDKFGIELLEGYGCTEMSPVISVNVPDVGQSKQKGSKAGTVGHPLPGVVTKVVHAETREPLAPGAEGLLLVKGPGRMLGYLGNPDAEAQAFDGDWYITGDIVSVDDDGFITIRDRLSRFSKIAGEMVPHLKVEEVLSDILDDGACVVTAIPDESKGERLVALYVKDDIAPDDVWAALNDSALPKLWVPKRDSVHRIDAIPLLGTGKVDLRRVKALALELSGDRVGRAAGT